MLVIRVQVVHTNAIYNVTPAEFGGVIKTSADIIYQVQQHEQIRHNVILPV